MRFLLCFLFLAIATSIASAGIIGKQVQYIAETVTLNGCLAYDDKSIDKRPGVLVHE